MHYIVTIFPHFCYSWSLSQTLVFWRLLSLIAIVCQRLTNHCKSLVTQHKHTQKHTRTPYGTLDDSHLSLSPLLFHAHQGGRQVQHNAKVRSHQILTVSSRNFDHFSEKLLLPMSRKFISLVIPGNFLGFGPPHGGHDAAPQPSLQTAVSVVVALLVRFTFYST